MSAPSSELADAASGNAAGECNDQSSPNRVGVLGTGASRPESGLQRHFPTENVRSPAGHASQPIHDMSSVAANTESVPLSVLAASPPFPAHSVALTLLVICKCAAGEEKFLVELEDGHAASRFDLWVGRVLLVRRPSTSDANYLFDVMSVREDTANARRHHLVDFRALWPRRPQEWKTTLSNRPNGAVYQRGLQTWPSRKSTVHRTYPAP